MLQGLVLTPARRSQPFRELLSRTLQELMTGHAPAIIAAFTAALQQKSLKVRTESLTAVQQSLSQLMASDGDSHNVPLLQFLDPIAKVGSL